MSSERLVWDSEAYTMLGLPEHTCEGSLPNSGINVYFQTGEYFQLDYSPPTVGSEELVRDFEVFYMSHNHFLLIDARGCKSSKQDIAIHQGKGLQPLVAPEELNR